MPEVPNAGPDDMARWHVNQLKGLFPQTIQNGFWLPKTQNVSRKLKSALGISTDPKYKADEQAQSVELFTKAAESRDAFLAYYRELKNGGHSPARDRELRNLARDSAVEALQGFHDHGSIHINKFYDRNVPYKERLLAYRRWTRTIDHLQDIYAKLPGVLGDRFLNETKAAEDAQVQIRADAIAELVITDPAVVYAQEQLNIQQNTYAQGVLDSTLRDARSRITAEVILHSIKTINPASADPNAFENQAIHPVALLQDSGGGTIDIGGLKKYPANNRTYNCARVVPATVGVMFGAKLKAVAALDDREADSDIRAEWANAYEKVYGGKFSSADSLDQLFDVVQACPPGTTGIIYNAWTGTRGAHVSVVSNVGGVACMVEGQTSRVMVRNPFTRQFESHSLGPSGVVVQPYDPKMLTNIKFLTVQPEVSLTEHDRAKAVIEELHKPFFERNDDTREIAEIKPTEPKHYYVPSPHEQSESTSGVRMSPNMIGPPPGPMPSPRPTPPGPGPISPPPLTR